MKRRSVLAGLAGTGALLLAGCGGGGSVGGETKKLSVAYVPAVTYPYLWQAADAGYFKEAGLDVKLVSMSGGLAIIPALESGDIQFGGSDVVGGVSAVAQDVPVAFLTVPAYATAAQPIQALVTANGRITSARDLVGKQVAVNLKFNVEWVMLRNWLRKQGVNPDDVKIVEVPFPDMIPALQSGKLDAAALIEPFVAQAKLAQLNIIAPFWAEVSSDMAISGILGNRDFMKNNPNTTAAFNGALAKGIKDLESDPSLARKLLSKYTKMDPSLAGSVSLPSFRASSDTGQIRQWIDWAVSDKVVDKKIDAKKLLWEGNASK